MKTLTLSLLACLFTVLSFGQSLTVPTTSQLHIGTSAPHLFLNSDRAQFASIEKTEFNKDYYLNAFREASADQCAKFKKMKLIGIILASAGGGLLITGIALEAVAVHDETGAYYNGYTYVGATTDVGLVAGGGVCIAFGLIGVGGGIPLAVIGSVKCKKYCGGGRSELQLGTNGHNLALNF